MAWALALAGALAGSAAIAENAAATPASIQPMTISFFIDRRLPPDVRPSLDEARRRLSDSRCADVLKDFEDLEGRRLDGKVAALGLTAASYLSLVLFYDGRATAPCGFRSTLAWTNTGSRAVHVCWSQFLVQQRWNVGYTANTLIHETLHTLGLGETPPDPHEITWKVAERCGN
jgi:hypothetical protein